MSTRVRADRHAPTPLVLCAMLAAACDASSNGTGPAPADVPAVDTPAADVQVVDVPRDVAVDAPPAMTRTAATQYHYDAARSGANRTESRLTVAAVLSGGLHRDAAFAPTLDGQVYAQPLYVPGLTVMGAAHDVLFVATQANTVYALDALTGAALWNTNLGAPVLRSAQPCGNISPTTGVLGTPVIDPVTRTLYAVAYTSTGGLTFTINALDLTTGTQRAGYPAPIDPPASNGATWAARAQQERGALALVGGKVYVPFGGLYGDCGTYHGWIVGIDAANPTAQTSFATDGNAAGIWAPGGAASDGAGHLYTVTGNAISRGTMGNRVLRLGIGAGGPTLAAGDAEFFQPSNTAALDAADIDLGTIAPIPVDHAGSSTPHLVFTAGKSGVANLINRDDLGGRATGNGVTGEGVYSARVFGGGAWGGAATWSNGAETYVFLAGHGPRPAPCTGSGGVAALRLGLEGGASAFSVAWCTGAGTNPGAPTVSSNGNADAILWTTDAQSRTLRAHSIANGAMIFDAAGPDAPPSVRQWTPPLVVDGRVYVTGSSIVSLYRLTN